MLSQMWTAGGEMLQPATILKWRRFVPLVRIPVLSCTLCSFEHINMEISLSIGSYLNTQYKFQPAIV